MIDQKAPAEPATPHDLSLVGAAEALAQVQAGTKIRFLDASFFLPNMGREAGAEFDSAHIQGAIYFDLERHSDPASGLPHSLPAREILAGQMAEIGLDEDDWIICYDNSPFLSAARAWWMLRYLGHARTSILDGGLRSWTLQNGPTESGPSIPRRGTFTLRPSLCGTASIDEIAHWINHPNERQILDARPHARFTGESPEPRPGMRSGHMPNALNVPVTELLDPDALTLRPLPEIEAVFRRAGVQLEQPVTTTCGSGVTACGLAFGLHLLGQNDVKLYDGSWAEWAPEARDPDHYPVVTGE